MFYYFDDGKKFSSKIQAYQYGLTCGKDAKLYYFDDIFSSYKWAEPEQTLDYLYIEQAKRIRDQYDYVILCYSGGYDSTNILETFYFNNIKIDKIVVVGALSQDSAYGVNENNNGELYTNAFPYLKELGLENITEIYDYSTMFSNLSSFSIAKYDDSWIHHIGTRFSVHNWFWHDLEKHVVPNQWKEKKVAILFGKDKPNFMWVQNKAAFSFSDLQIMNYGTNESLFDNSHRINFYWDPSYPYILFKQLYILKRYYSKHHLSSKSLDHIIYNLKKPLVFKSKKSMKFYISKRDNFILNKKDSDIYKLYKAGMMNYHNSVGLESLPVINSKIYTLSD